MFKRALMLLSLTAFVTAALAVAIVGGPLALARADIDRERASALLPAQTRQADAQAVIAEQAALERRTSAAFWMAFWARAQRWAGVAAFVGVMGITIVTLMTLAAPVAYLWIFTFSHAALIWPDVRGNLPISPGNPILFDAEKALQLSTNAQIAGAIVASVRAQGDVATAQTIGQSVSQALVALTDTLGARQARAIATPDRRWVHPRAQADIAGDNNRDWAADMIQFIERGSEPAIGFSRRSWAGKTLPSGKLCTPTVWEALCGDLKAAKIARIDGRGHVAGLAISVPEALARLELA